MVIGTEYDHQKACVEYLLGYARAKGIEVVIPKESALLKQPYAYGYEFPREEWPVSDLEIKTKLDQLKKDLQETRDKAYTFDGAIQEVQFHIRGMPNAEGEVMAPIPKEYEAKLQERLAAFINKKEDALNKLYSFDGAIQELEWWVQIIELRKKNVGVTLLRPL